MSNEKQNFLLYQLSPLRKLEEVNLKERGKKEKYIEDIFHPTEERDCIIDTLAFNKSNNSFLIIEYKREKTVELFYQVREYMECLEEVKKWMRDIDNLYNSVLELESKTRLGNFNGNNKYCAFSYRLRYQIQKISLLSSIAVYLTQINVYWNFKKPAEISTNLSNLLNNDNNFQKLKSFIHEYKNQKPLKALIFDLLYNRYYGVIIYVRIFEGELTKGQKIKFYTNQQKVYQAERVGVKIPKEILKNKLVAGEIDHHISPLAGYQEIKPNVYSNLYPSESSQFKEFKKYLEELQVQDSSLSLESVDSQLLGSGFRCGFLGLLHREIICERLQKEYNCEIITTPPSITYRVVFNNGEILETSNPQKISAKGKIKSIEELLVNLEITTPEEHLGDILQICQNKRGILHRDAAYDRAKVICENLKKTLNRQTFAVPVQACIGNQVIARETLPALKKNVISRIHGGGSIDRKMKL
ncbi:249_t:CDS:2 [Funneliformis geosporum]|uniref:249_t:CDS:1 n=1 Tax=Funneliformis geosporum TaxID=1117311 RepID=A0A9W4SL45_9GLOM|nr:249_t:CDS:2 [Funneliformis geosporum]